MSSKINYSEDGIPIYIISEEPYTAKYKNTLEILGNGGYGKVYKFELENGDKVAGKVIDKEKYKGENIIKKQQLLKDEINIQKSFNRPDIVKVIDYMEDEKYFFIFLEYCKNGSLQKLLKKRGKLTEREVACYMLQLIVALNNLHIHKIIHRDLKPDNLLLGNNMELKIGDFGLATLVDGKIKDDVGTITYMAPEILKKEEYSFEADIWSLGVVMCYLLTKKNPFYDQKTEILKKNIIEGGLCLSSNLSDVASDLIKQILVKDPLKRPSLNQIIYHDFFNREGIPRYFPVSTLNECPEEYSKDILNKKEIIYNDLKSIVRPIINPITYDSIQSIDEIRVNQNQLNDINTNIYIKDYLEMNKRFGFGYVLNNGKIGVYYKDKTKILLNPVNNKLLYIDRKDESYNYNMQDYPDNLKNKIKILKGFVSYFEKKKDYNNDNFESKDKYNEEKEDKTFNIYVNNVILNKKCISFKLTNETDHIFFADKVEIILSNNEQKIIYIDKDKNKINLQIKEAVINPCIELKRRIKYIQLINIASIITNINKKIVNFKEKPNNEEKEKTEDDNSIESYK